MRISSAVAAEGEAVTLRAPSPYIQYATRSQAGADFGDLKWTIFATNRFAAWHLYYFEKY